MERNVLKRKWYVLFNELKERWPDLTQSDIDYITADKKRLIEIVRRRRHLSEAEAARDVEDFLNTRDVRQRVA
ncbi:MAG TPA: hypothetical protein VKK06_12925 [Terriglobia bacterium]|nr:hypothetical protein [Terriglobia bacterium]